MRIELDKEYGIKRADNLNICLYRWVTRSRVDKKTKKKTGETYIDEEVLGYYGRLDEALRGYIKYSTKLADVDSIQELLDRLETARNDIERAVSHLKNEKGILANLPLIKPNK